MAENPRAAVGSEALGELPSMPASKHEPVFNPIAPVVIILVLVVVGIEARFQLGAAGLLVSPEAIGWRVEAIQSYSFSSPVFHWMVTTDRWPLEHLVRFVSYPFVQIDLPSAVILTALVLAMGKVVADKLGMLAFLVLFFVSAILAAVGNAIIWPDAPPLFGLYAPTFGLVGAYAYLLWFRLVGQENGRRHAVILVSFLLGLQIMLALLLDANSHWGADIIGFFVGAVTSFLVTPGALKRILRKLRER